MEFGKLLKRLSNELTRENLAQMKIVKVADAHASSAFVKWKMFCFSSSSSPSLVLVLLVSRGQQTKRKHRGQIEIIMSYKACRDLFLKNHVFRIRTKLISPVFGKIWETVFIYFSSFEASSQSSFLLVSIFSFSLKKSYDSPDIP